MLTRALVIAALVGLVGAGPASATEGWQWPLRGDVLAAFHNGDDPYAAGQHRGVDIAGAGGSEVVAAVGGTVRFAGPLGSSGLTVSVRSADGRFDTSYLHLSVVAVRKGSAVRAGQRVGAVGTTGRRSVTAPHLHFGVREAGDKHAYRNPLDFLPPLTPAPREAPRGAPVPVAVPRPVAVAPEPVRMPGRVRAPSPRGIRAPEPRRVPAGRRVRVPVGGKAPRVVPRPGVVPIRPLVPAPALRPAPRGRSRGRVPERSRAPQAGPVHEPAPVAAPVGAPAGAPAKDHAGAPASGPDLGWALACLGLLLAAACLGRPGKRGEGESGKRKLDLAGLLRPLSGRRR